MTANRTKQVSVVMIITVISKVLGFLRDIVLARYFGAGSVTDAYFVAQTIPESLFSLVVQAISIVFIPIYTQLLHNKGDEQANKFVDSILKLSLILCVFLVTFVNLFPKYIVAVFASGFDSQTTQYAITFVRISVFAMFFRITVAIYAAYLQSNEQFTVPAFNGVILDVVSILTIILAYYTKSIILVWGIIGASFIKFIALFPSVRKLKPIMSFSLKIIINEEVRQMLMEDINTDFLSMTLETLAKIMLEGVIYKDEIIISRQDYDMIVKISSKSKNDSSILNYIKGKRQVDVNIWKDLFAPYIENCNEFKATLHSFISDRNHIAHSKVLSWSAYQTIRMDFLRIKEQIKRADVKYELDEASAETTAKWIIEQEQQDNIELYEIEYNRDRLKNEAGLDILDENEIEDWFDSTLFEKLYNKIYNRYHLDLCFDISDYSSPSENCTVFTVSCPVDDVELYIEVNAECTIDDELGGDSTCSIEVIKGNGETIHKANIYVHNGNGVEGEEGLMEPTEDTELDTSELDELLNVLVNEIDALNPYPALLNALTLESKGTEQFVADFPCDQCGKLGVSVNEALLPIGKCCYCGYENDVKRCARCESIVEELKNDLCLSCSEFVEKQ